MNNFHAKTPENPPETPKKPDKYITERIKISKLIPGGQAIATLASGKKIFLWNALPGETVTRARLIKEKSSYAEAIAETIAQPAPERIAPRDACYLATSPWQILEYNYELEQKRQILQEIFRQQKVELAEPIPAPLTDGRDYHYRNKMEYALYYSFADQRIHPAFRGRGSHRKLPVASSSLERPEIWQAAERIMTDLVARGEEAWKYQMVLLRCDQLGQVSGGPIPNHQKRPVWPELQDQILGDTYHYSPNGFFQINLPVYEMALRAIQAHLGSGPVLDLYAGVGTIGLSVAQGRALISVESDGSAYRELERNAAGRTAKFSHLEVIHARSEEVLSYIAPDQTVIVDPPRAGCDPRLITRLCEVLPEKIIYLSCNPITQARDAAGLAEHYRITTILPFNFFPRTPHLENLLVFERRAR